MDGDGSPSCSPGPTEKRDTRIFPKLILRLSTNASTIAAGPGSLNGGQKSPATASQRSGVIITNTNDHPRGAAEAGSSHGSGSAASANSVKEGSVKRAPNDMTGNAAQTDNSMRMTSLMKNVSDLEESFSQIGPGLEAMEAKLAAAEKIQEKIEDLRKMKLPSAKLAEESLLFQKLNVKILKALKVHEKIKLLQKEIGQLEASSDYMKNKDIELAQADYTRSKKVLRSHRETVENIQKLKKSSYYISSMEQVDLSENIMAAKKRMESLKSKIVEDEIKKPKRAYEELVDELECIICFTLPDETRAFSCSNHHLMCHNCIGIFNDKCPVCQQDFRKNPPTRNRLAEAMISRLSKKLKMLPS